MTTEKLVTKLKNLGADDEQAEGFRDLRLESEHVGSVFKIPVPIEDRLLMVTAYFTGADREYVPVWDSVSETVLS